MKEFLIVFSLFAIITFLGVIWLGSISTYSYFYGILVGALGVGTFYNYFKNKEQ